MPTNLQSLNIQKKIKQDLKKKKLSRAFKL